MDKTIRPVTIRNNNNKNMVGILHTCGQPRPGVGIILLSPGIKNRVGPHRMYVKMTERLTRMGFPVLRADPEGLGDSEGEIDRELTADVYGAIEVGLLVKDTIVMMDWMSAELGVTRFILGGLCGGAITALLTAEKRRPGRPYHFVGHDIRCVEPQCRSAAVYDGRAAQYHQGKVFQQDF